MTGVQYALGPHRPPRRHPPRLPPRRWLRPGAHRSAAMTRGRYLRPPRTSPLAKVPVGAAQTVTSAHISMTANGLTLPHVAWGNGAAGSGAGPAAQVTCATCHNPHGNGQYRILNNIQENSPVTRPGLSTSARRTRQRRRRRADPGSPTTSTRSLARPQLGDRVTIAGSSDAALNGTWYVKTVGTGARARRAPANFTVSATLGGAIVDITADGTGGTVARSAASRSRRPRHPGRRHPQLHGDADQGHRRATTRLVPAVRRPGRHRRRTNTFNGIAGNYTASAATTSTGPCRGTRRSTSLPSDDPAVSQPPAARRRTTPRTASRDLQRPDHPVVRLVPHPVLRQQQPVRRRRSRRRDRLVVAVPAAGRLPVQAPAPDRHGPGLPHLPRLPRLQRRDDRHVLARTLPVPGRATDVRGSSRLLKVDNRGTCQACHDPTGTVAAGTTLPAVRPRHPRPLTDRSSRWPATPSRPPRTPPPSVHPDEEQPDAPQER